MGVRTVRDVSRHHNGAQRGNRTLDLFITSEMLCRLSYLGAVRESNEATPGIHTAIGTVSAGEPSALATHSSVSATSTPVAATSAAA